MVEIGKVLSSTPGTIQVILNGIEVFEANKSEIRISRYVVIEDGNNLKILASIQNITAVQSEAQTISYTLSCTPIGCYLEKEDGLDFRQGGVNLPSPTEPVYLPDTEIVNSIFSSNDNFSFYVGTLSNNQAINYYVDGNRFFGKHIAVVGSTGSGKSCAVARLLQNIMKINHGRNENVDSIKNSHVIIFDIHSEYQSAFTLDQQEGFSLNCLDVEKLCLPYWLMNSQELESLFIESIVISLLSRIIFDFAFHYSKLRHHEGKVNDIPFMLVCEEAHNYIPKSGGAEYAASKHSIERIAKEGRKYGLSLMVVSQRPSEVSDTIFSQCNNFVVLKLTNINDQNCIKNLLPDNNSSLVDVLPTLSAGECLIVGDAAPLPAVIKMDMPNPIPNSSNVNVYDEWNKNWIDIAFETVIKRWWKE